MKTTRVAKRSSARTKHQIKMERLRNGQCVVCAGPMVRLETGAGDILPREDHCGACRFKAMQQRGD